MESIDVRTDVAFAQAVLCVGRRYPRNHRLKPSGYALALGIRYALIGAATAHHLLLSSPDQEEPQVVARLYRYPLVVDEAVRNHGTAGTVPASVEQLASVAAGICREVMMSYLPRYRKLCPLEATLDLAVMEILHRHRGDIRAGWRWPRLILGEREMKRHNQESVAFAINFFERRQANLQEVPEIALLGE